MPPRKGKMMPLKGNRLKDRRESRGLTQDDLATRIGVSRKQLGRYERGQSDPTTDVLIRIAKELNCSIDWLAGLVSEPAAITPDIDPETRDFLERFRRLPKDIRDLIMRLVRGEH